MFPMIHYLVTLPHGLWEHSTYSMKKNSEVVEHVDSCFGIWGPEAGQKQKIMYDNRKSCPKEGRVSVIEKRKIEKNWLMNDVSTALWAKARSLHKLDEIELAKTSYGLSLIHI